MNHLRMHDTPIRRIEMQVDLDTRPIRQRAYLVPQRNGLGCFVTFVPDRTPPRGATEALFQRLRER